MAGYANLDAPPRAGVDLRGVASTIRPFASIWLTFADVTFDALVALSLMQAGRPQLAMITLGCIGAQYFASWLAVLLWMWSQFGVGCEWTRNRGVYSRGTACFAALGLPLGPLLLDLCLFLEPLLLLVLPRQRTLGKSPILDAGQLRPLLPPYRSTRLVLATLLESLPQAVFQAYLYKSLFLDEGFQGFSAPSIPQETLAISLALSLLSVARLLAALGLVACDAGVNLFTALRAAMGMDLTMPLDALRRDAIDEWTCEPGALSAESSARLLASALRANRSLKKLVLDEAQLDDNCAKLLFSGYVGGPSPTLPALQALRFDGNSVGNLGLEALARASSEGALPSLKTVSGRRNEVMMSGVQTMGYFAKRGAFFSLETLDLSANKINEKGMKALAASATDGALPSLQFFGLDDNRYPDAVVQDALFARDEAKLATIA